LALLVLGNILIYKYNKAKVTENNGPQISEDKTEVFQCDNGRSITATFHTPDNAVDLVLSGGMEIYVPRATSASGAKYANSNETFVFWNKGNTAFITEGTDKKETYSNCAQK